MNGFSTTNEQDNQQIARRWLVKSLTGNVVLAAIMFVSAGTLRWPMAWALAILFTGVAVATYLLVDPALIAERTTNRRSSEKWDNVIMAIYGLITMILVPVIAGLDFRYGWTTSIAWGVQALALAANIAGWSLHIWAMRVNAFFAIVVRLQEDRGQTVVSAGPYRWVRHPGYTGGILFSLATPLMLGSVWALPMGFVGAALLVVRTSLEDRMLQERLDGYREYTQRTKFRLLPGVW